MCPMFSISGLEQRNDDRSEYRAEYRSLGHKGHEMALGIYAHALPSMQQDAAARVGVILHGEGG